MELSPELLASIQRVNSLGAPPAAAPTAQTPSWGTRAIDTAAEIPKTLVSLAGVVPGAATLVPALRPYAMPVLNTLQDVNRNIGLAYQSPDYLAREQAVSDAGENETDIISSLSAKAKALIDNPSVLVAKGVGMVPMSIGAGLVGAGTRALAGARGVSAIPGAARVAAMGDASTAAVGEGLLTTGMSAGEMATKSPDDPYAPYWAIPAGIITGGVARGIGAISPHSDADVALLRATGLGAARPPVVPHNVPASRVMRGALGVAQESTEEFLQSGQEKAWGNIAAGDPWSKGVGAAAIEGALTAAPMGGLAGLSSPAPITTNTLKDLTAPAVTPMQRTANGLQAAPAVTQETPDQRAARIKAIYETPPAQPRVRTHDELSALVNRPAINPNTPVDINEAAQGGIPSVDTASLAAAANAQFEDTPAPTANNINDTIVPIDTNGAYDANGNPTGFTSPDAGVAAPSGYEVPLAPMHSAAVAAAPVTQEAPAAAPAAPAKRVRKSKSKAGALIADADIPKVAEEDASSSQFLTQTKLVNGALRSPVPEATPREAVAALGRAALGRVHKDTGNVVVSGVDSGNVGGRIELSGESQATMNRAGELLRDIVEIQRAHTNDGGNVIPRISYKKTKTVHKQKVTVALNEDEAERTSSGNVASLAGVGKGKGAGAYKRGERLSERVQSLDAQKEEVAAKFEELTNLLGPRSVDAIMANIKKRMTAERSSKSDEQQKADTSVDVLLSSAWNAAKQEAARPDAGSHVRQSPTRTSWAESKAMGSLADSEQPLVIAANEGYASRGNGEATGKGGTKDTGFLGVLNYSRAHGTLLERTLASAIHRVMKRTGSVANVVFLSNEEMQKAAAADGVKNLDTNPVDGFYSNRTDTIYLPPNASPALALHEGLHAALNYYVQKNPQAAPVRALAAALKEAKKHVKELPAEVQEAINLIDRAGTPAKRVQELVSYALTNNEIARALSGLASTAETKLDATQQERMARAKSTPFASGLLKSIWEGFRNLMYYAFRGALPVTSATDTLMTDISDWVTVALEDVSRGERTGKTNAGASGAQRSSNNVTRVTSVVKTLMNSPALLNNKVVIAETVAELPKHIQNELAAEKITDEEKARIQGFVSNDGKAYLIAGKIEPGKELSVLLHEVGVHMGMAGLIGDENVRTLTTQVEKWAKGPADSQEARIARGALERAKGNSNEYIAYFVEEAVAAGIDPTAIQKDQSELGKWFRTLWAAVKSSLRALGINPAGLTAQNIVDLAMGAARMELAGDSASVRGIQFSMQPVATALASAGQHTPEVIMDYSRFAPSQAKAEVLFNALGWKNVPAYGTEKAAKLATLMREKLPGLMGSVSYVAARANVTAKLEGMLDILKSIRHKPVGIGHEFLSQLTNKSNDEQIKALTYLDDVSMGEGIPARTKSYADKLRSELDRLVAAMPDSEAKTYLAGLKPSESLTWVTSVGDVASRSFGVHNINAVVGKEKASVPTDGLIAPVNKDGLKTTEGRFYSYLDNTGAMAGMIHESMLNEPKALKLNGVDRSSPWKYVKAAKADAEASGQNNLEFARQQSAINALKGPNPADIKDVSDAMLNTLSILSNAVATNSYTTNLADEAHADGMKSSEGAKTRAVYAADDMASLKKDLGYEPDVLNLGSKEGKSPALLSAHRSPNSWVKVPDTAAYGKLRGMIVNGSVWSATVDAVDRSPFSENAIFRKYSSVLRFFKSAVTRYSLPTWVNNTMSNYTLAYLHNLSFTTVAKANLLYLKYKTRPAELTAEESKIVDDFINSGAVLADYSTAEVKADLYDRLIKQMKEKGAKPGYISELDGHLGRARDALATAAKFAKKYGTKTDDVMSEIYASQDNAFRLAAFMSKMGELEKGGVKGTDAVSQAGLFAKKAFLDYDIDSKAVQALRQTLLPFVSWTYAATPVLAKIALHQPWKLATLVAAYSVASALLAAGDEGGDEEDKKRRARDRKDDRIGGIGPYTFMRMPFLDSPGQRAYADVGKWIPMPLSFKENPNGFLGFSRFPSAITPNGPLVTLLSASFGVDQYTGRKITKATDSDMEKFLTISSTIAGSMFPGNVKRAVNPKIGPLGHQDADFEKAAKFFGVPLDVVDEQEAKVYQGKEVKGIKADFAKEISKIKGDVRIGKMTPEAAQERIAVLKERRTEHIAHAKGVD